MHFERVSGDGTDSVFPGAVAGGLPTNSDQGHGSGSIFPDAVSPSLRPWTPGAAPAFEIKFLIDETCAREVEAVLGPQMSLDPHADPGLGNAYRTTTVYCETPQFDVFRGLGVHKSRKYRLRSYAENPAVFLERKSRRGERVRKRRTAVPRGDLARLTQLPAEDWSAAWFHRQVRERALGPICSVQYVRTAYVGGTDEGPLRLTFDRELKGSGADGWSPEFAAGGIPFLPDLVICEFKFRAALPSVFKSAIQDLQLVPAKVSKYRRCLDALGIAGLASTIDSPPTAGLRDA